MFIQIVSYLALVLFIASFIGTVMKWRQLGWCRTVWIAIMTDGCYGTMAYALLTETVIQVAFWMAAVLFVGGLIGAGMELEKNDWSSKFWTYMGVNVAVGVIAYALFTAWPS